MQQIKPNEEKTILFEQAPISKAVAALCIPTMISSLVFVIYGLADTYFVGLLNDPVQNAAVTLANPGMMLFHAITNLFGVGGASVMSRAFGGKDYTRAMQTSCVGIYCTAVMGALYSGCFVIFRQPILSLLGADAITQPHTWAYLKWTCLLGAVPSVLNVVLSDLTRAEGAAARASVGIVGGCVMNMILDPIFIMPWGLNMGAEGAGAATCLSNFAVCAYFLLMIVKERGRTFLCMHPSMFRPGKLIASICAVGIPAAIANLLTTAGMIILNKFTASYGAVAVVAMGIAFRVDLIPCNVCSGLSSGLMPLISYNYASGNSRRMKQAFRFALISAFIGISTVAAFYFFFPQIPISLFIEDQEVVALGAIFLKSLCIALPFYAVEFVEVGVFNACGLGWHALIFALLRNVILQIPALYILDAILPLYGVPYAFVFSEGVLSIVGSIVITRLLHRLPDTGKQP